MMSTLLAGFWLHFGAQDGTKIDKQWIQKINIFLFDFWSPKSANLGSQNLPKWIQDWPNCIKNRILSKSRNPTKTSQERSSRTRLSKYMKIFSIQLPTTYTHNPIHLCTYLHTHPHTHSLTHILNRRIKWHSSFWEHAFVYKDTGRSTWERYASGYWDTSRSPASRLDWQGHTRCS